MPDSIGQPSLSVVDEIRQEAVRPNMGRDGRPLPLAGHWNLGEASNGFSPSYQMKMIDMGHYFLPWFLMPSVDANPEDPFLIGYYEASIKRAAQLRLPIALIGTQWESLLASDDNYAGLPASKNPNVVLANGTIRREVSPFGPLPLWKEIGVKWGSSPMMKKLQNWYPDPPLVLFISNNEQRKLEWKNVEEDSRYIQMYGEGRDDDAKRKIVGDAWIGRYRALQDGIRDGLTGAAWKEKSLFVGYDAFGPAHLGRWLGWMEYSLYTKGRIDPWPLAWDGGSPSFYVYNWAETMTDYTVFSPQIEAMNWTFMQDEARKFNSTFWFEMSVWDGHEPQMANDKRKAYELAGQKFSPERYGGMVQFGMWLLRPRVVREFRGYQDTLEHSEPYFLPIVDAVDRVHRNQTLREFWRKGQLVPNRESYHPYQTAVPAEFQNVDRWFLLDTSYDPRRPWDLGTRLPVYSLALVMGNQPRRQWLVYAHSPLEARKNVLVTIPEYRAVNIDVSVGGSFYLIDETLGNLVPMSLSKEKR